MESCKHKFKLDRPSFIIVNGKNTEVNVWKCIECGKLYIQDCKTAYRIRLNGKMGEEI